MQSLIAFSNVRWDAMRQRPQHLLMRLARTWSVLFVEEPVFNAGHPRAELRARQAGITVLTPHTPLTAPGFHDDQIPLLSKLLGHAIARERMHDYGAWLCTPMALPLLQRLDPRVVVYDCMDDLAALRGAPRQLQQRESALLRIANVVFCSSDALYDVRKDRHASVHAFANSVDGAHFARATDPTSTNPRVSSLARPRLGFAGVIDERIDLALLEAVAAARPEWELCIVGPLVNVDAASLPRAPNLHYFGPCTYDELPSYLAGWDVALLPLVQGDATRAVSPANLLEYMAAERSVVSTAVADVERLHGDVVRVAATPAAFIAACDAALVESQAARASRVARMRRTIAAASWDETARAMRRIVEAKSLGGLTEAARMMLEPPPCAPQPMLAASRRAPCVILGAGATGLAAAHHYGAGSLLLEREANVGGGCRSIEDTGFTFDRAGHVMVSEDPYVQDLYRLLLGDNVHWQDCEAWVYRDRVYTRQSQGPDARFGYPLHGGFQSLMNGFLPLLHGDVVLRADVARVSPRLRAVTLGDGRRFHFDTLISTLPLPRLIAAAGDEAPAVIRRAASELRHASLRCVNLGIARPRVTDKHWIDFPEGTIFRRVFAQGNASPHCNPPGGFGLTCEFTYSPTKPLPATGSELVERCVRDCVAVGLLDAGDALLTSNQVDVRCAYVIDDDGRADRVALIRDWLAGFDILVAGRYGEWVGDPDHAFVAGRKAAEAALRVGATRVAAKTA